MSKIKSNEISDQEILECAAIRIYRYCRKFKKDINELGYPEKLTEMVIEVQKTHPNSPETWIVKKGFVTQAHQRLIRDREAQAIEKAQAILANNKC